MADWPTEQQEACAKAAPQFPMNLTKSKALLDQFPGPVVIHASIGKWLFMALVYTILSALGALWALAAVSDPSGGVLIGGTVWAMVWAFMAAKAWKRLLGGKMKLTLDDKGFFRRSLWGNGNFFGWPNTSQFVPTRVGSCDTVAFNDATRSDSFWSRSDQALQGGNARLADDYGFDAGELALLLNQWRERALETVNVEPRSKNDLSKSVTKDQPQNTRTRVHDNCFHPDCVSEQAEPT